MKKQSEFQIDARPLTEAVRKAVDEGDMNLSDIATRAGLSVPTIARIYSEEVKFVQVKTARRIGDALGYQVRISDSGGLRLIETDPKDQPDGLTSVQKAKLLRAFQRLLDQL